MGSALAGLTTIELWKYALASWAGMLPGTFAYVYLGSVGKATLSAGDGMPPAKLAVFGAPKHALAVVVLRTVACGNELGRGSPVLTFVATCRHAAASNTVHS